MASPVTFAQICEWAMAPQLVEERSPLGPDPFLLIDADAAASLDGADRSVVAGWLRGQRVPTIVRGLLPASLMAAVDVVLEPGDDGALLLSNIGRNPIAASVLVQLLRATEGMAPDDALNMESLAYATLQSGPEFLTWLQDPQRKRSPPLAPMQAEGPAVQLVREGDRLGIELNRPERRNAISVELRDALIEAFRLIDADSTIRGAQLRGAGRCFSIGGDLDEFGTAPDPASGHAIRGLTLPARFLLRCADRVEARLHGACIGAGIELPAFAHRVVATADAFFQLPELRFGLIPGAGGCVGLPRRIGRQRTAALVLSGRRLNAATALDWGLVDALV